MGTPRKSASRVFATVIDAVEAAPGSVRTKAKDAGLPYMALRHWLEGKEPAAFARLERLALVHGLCITVQKAEKPRAKPQ